MPIETVPISHAVAPDQGRNVHCVCGAEYSLVRNLVNHVDRENARAAIGACIARHPAGKAIR